jgi:diguanylate cyclase (GGDEF)-like protein/PAS domain S-box-containing protein
LVDAARQHTVAALPVLGAALVFTWLDASVSSLTATAATIATLCVGYAAMLAFLAVGIHRQTRSFGNCRGAGFVAVGVGLTGATAAAVAAIAARGPRYVMPAGYVAAAGLCLVVLAFLSALLILPGASTSSVVRLRRALDGLSVGVCVLFIVWLVLISPHGQIGLLGFGVALVTCCAVAMALLIAVPLGRRRPAVLFCALGVALCVIGLGILAAVLSTDNPADWPWISALPLAVGPPVVWASARRTARYEEGPAEGVGTYSAYPVMGVPVVAAIAVTLHRVLTGGVFDRPSIALGIVCAAAVTLRESLAALDVARYARKVAAQEAHYRSLVSGSSDVIVTLDDDLVVRWQSPAAARQFSLSDHDVVGRPFLSLLHPDDAGVVGDRLGDVRVRTGHRDERGTVLVEARLRDGFGQWRDTESTICDQRDTPEVRALVVHIRDVSERKDLEHTVRHLAYTDQLTGLANRRQLLLTLLALRAAPGGGRGALLLIELNGFTGVNDVRGHETGDAVLIEVARRLRAGVGETDQPARLGGDEFAVATETSALQAYALATRLLTMLAEPYVLPGATVYLTASIGLANVGGTASVDETLRQADLARRRARQEGRSRVEWYDQAMEHVMLRRMTLEQELPGVLGRDELDVVYQPVLDLRHGIPVGVEALLRWRHPRLGTMLTRDLISVAEQLGMIHEIGAWVLHQACRQLASWRRDGRDLWVGVNISPREFNGHDIPEQIRTVLDLHEVPGDRLIIEIAEDNLGADAQVIGSQLAELRALGVRTALDNFGSGQESLAVLRRLPLDMIKIGQSFFVDPQRATDPALPIIDVMVGLGRRLGIEVVAEGLEEPAQLELVSAAGARFGQGRLLARPEPAEHVEAFLDNFRGRCR